MGDLTLTKAGLQLADSTCTKGDSILDCIEKMLDKKLKPIEHRLSMLEQSKDDRMLVKIQKLVDELTDQHESASRKIKDEVYSVQDTLDTLSETMTSIKEDVREGLLNSDSVLDKVVKVHKHMAVGEVAKLTEKKVEINGEDSDQIKDLKDILAEQDKKLERLIENQQNLTNLVEKLVHDQSEAERGLDSLKESNQHVISNIAANWEKSDKITKSLELISDVINKNDQKLSVELKMQEDRIVESFNKTSSPNANIMEEHLQPFIAKKTAELKKSVTEKCNEILKTLNDNHIEETKTRTVQFGETSKCLKELLKNHFPEINRKVSVLNATVCDISTSVSNQETDFKSCINSSSKKILETILKREKMLQKMGESVDKNINVSGEIINSIEDLKQLTSSIITNESAPNVENIQTDVKDIKNSLREQSREEKHLLEKLSSVEQENFTSIMKKFEIVEHRFGVIRKYVKNVPAALEHQQLCAQIPRPTHESSTPETILDTSSPSSILELKLHTSSQCKILGDSIATSLDHFISALDLKKHMEEFFSKMVIPMLTQIKMICKEISEEQAKGVVVEDQLQALANTILEPIEELKPLHEQLLATVEEELRFFSKNDSLERVLANQANIIMKLNRLKSRSKDDIRSLSESCIDIIQKLKQTEQDHQIEMAIDEINVVLESIKNGQHCHEELKEKLDDLGQVNFGETDLKNLVEQLVSLVNLLSPSDAKKGKKRRKSSSRKEKRAYNKRSRKTLNYNENSDNNSEVDGNM